ncbi:MAG: Rieske 2Fe-2S domain-containing protein [Eubacteriales bacterium]|nr:Rieske 2Fe-2S domain-containing protein [Eubacteriales bacterium]
MQYSKVAVTTDIPPGGRKKVMLKDRALLLTNIDGEYFAIDDRCPHMGGSLYEGKLEGDTVICPKHKTVFSVKTGKVLKNGSIAFIRLNVADTRAYTVKIEGSNILVGTDEE